MLGFGLSLIYSPSLTMVGHYFKKRFGLINGIVTSGSAVFTLLMYYLLEFLLDHAGLPTCFRVLSGMMILAVLSSLTFEPVLMKEPRDPDAKDGCCASFLNVDNWRNPKYVIWIFSIFFGLFGYLVPLVHLMKFVQDILPDVDGKALLLCIQFASLVARLIFGKVADFKLIRNNRILLQQVP